MTLIEVAIAIGIAASFSAVAIGTLNSLTDADLRSTAVELSGAMKSSYDRAIMQRRTQRLAIDLDKGLWWFEYTESPFAISKEKATGEVGEKTGGREEDEDIRHRDRVTGKRKKRGKLAEKRIRSVEKMVEGTAARFQPDVDQAGLPPHQGPRLAGVERAPRGRLHLRHGLYPLLEERPGRGGNHRADG